MTNIINLTDYKKNKALKDWHDNAIKNVNVDIMTFRAILDKCPNMDSYYYHVILGMLVAKQTITLKEVAEWYSDINMDDISITSLRDSIEKDIKKSKVASTL
ncbi:MAG: hypothetical protein methR_P0582 [Methyloprofundus sp.]|nr:MAG: hypothetical protein methR_P0582 [Methyloprofundus sp.]